MNKISCLIVILCLVVSCKKSLHNNLLVQSTDNIQWSKIYGGSDLDLAYSAVESTDGDFIIAGYTKSSDGDVTENHFLTFNGSKLYGDDAWIIKIDKNGNIKWQHCYGAAPLPPDYEVPTMHSLATLPTLNPFIENHDQASAIVSLRDGNYLATGQTNKVVASTDLSWNPNYRTSRNVFNAFTDPTREWLFKVDENGNKIDDVVTGVSATYKVTPVTFSYFMNDTLNCALETANKEILCGGQTDNSFRFGDKYSGIDGLVTKRLNQTITHSFYGGDGYDKINSILEWNTSDYIFAGQTTSPSVGTASNHGRTDLWIGTSTGINKLYGGGSDDIANAIINTPDGGFIVAGQTSSNDGDVTNNHWSNADAWIIKLKPDLSIEWQKTYGGEFGDDVANSIVSVSDGYVFAGRTNSNDGDVIANHGYSDAWVVKIDKTGNILWQQTLGGSNVDVASSIIKTTDGGLLVTGYSFSNNGNISQSIGSGNYWVVKLKHQ